MTKEITVLAFDDHNLCAMESPPCDMLRNGMLKTMLKIVHAGRRRIPPEIAAETG